MTPAPAIGNLPRERRRPCSRRGTTLLELVLVLAVLVAIASLAWPLFVRAFAGRRLHLAAEQIQEQWLRARHRAMNTGEPQAFRFVPNSGQFRIEAYNPSGETTEDTAMAAAAVDEAGLGGAPIEADSSLGLLSGEALFLSPDGSAPPVDSFGQAVDDGGSQTWTEPILFFPDGAATSARVVIHNGSSYLAIDLRGLTGRATIGDWQPEGSAAP